MCLGIPGRIVALDPFDDRVAVVDVGGVRRLVDISCIVDAHHPPASCVGTWVLVHVGFALSRIDEAEAARTLALLAEIGDLQEQREGTP
jgi:hydrogenase expression/formation protein HypC